MTANGNGKVPETLFAALAAFQAELPKIAKGETAQVPTKQGGSYSYKYADLTDVSEAVLPRLGALGLVFFARPTTREDGKFGLAYTLGHVSGEREDGFYEIHVNGMTPQQIGGLITYARRYCLCAATGIAPGGDDDDASGAQQAVIRQSAADAFENAAPAPPRQNGRPQPPPPSPEAADAAAQAFADLADQARLPVEIENIHRQAREAGKVAALIRNPASGGVGKLAVYLDWKRKQLMAAKPAGLDDGDPWAAKVEELGDEDDAFAAISELADLLSDGKIDAERFQLVAAAIEARFPGTRTESAAA